MKDHEGSVPLQGVKNRLNMLIYTLVKSAFHRFFRQSLVLLCHKLGCYDVGVFYLRDAGCS